MLDNRSDLQICKHYLQQPDHPEAYKWHQPLPLDVTLILVNF